MASAATEKTPAPAATEEGAALAARLQAEAEAWAPPRDVKNLDAVDADDLPVVDLGPYLQEMERRECNDDNDADKTSAALEKAARQVGFMYVANHGLDAAIERGYRAARAFHATLPTEVKATIAMNKPGATYPRGTGYLATGNRVLPTRALPNYNESFVVKRELGPRDATLDKTPWPPSTSDFDGDEFRQASEELMRAYEALALKMLPVFALALGLPKTYFAPLFTSPVLRMRLASYDSTPDSQFGINPHVDTSFFTLLASTDFEGLVIYGKRKGKWLRATNDVWLLEGGGGEKITASTTTTNPSEKSSLTKDASTPVKVRHPLVVNTGQILCQLTNDAWTATRHFAVNPDTTTPRVSLPFFFNATATAPLAVLPSFCSPNNPPKYPTASYLDGQAVQQGE